MKKDRKDPQFQSESKLKLGKRSKVKEHIQPQYLKH